MKYTSIRVVGSGGCPQSNARVTLEIHQFAAGGMKGPQHTDSEGKTDFALDIDDGAKITVYVNGQEKVGRDKVRSQYQITI